MNRVLDDGLVGVLLAVSVAYAIYSLGPRAWRPRLLGAAAALLGRLPKVFGLDALARRLAVAAGSTSSGACGGCDNCGSAPARGSGAPAEVSVPLVKIRKRKHG